MADQQNTTSLAETTVADLEGALGKITDVAVVREAQKADTRVTAQPLYEARIAALSPGAGTSGASSTSTAGTSTSTKREAATRVKYNGKWYAPGDEITFAKAADAEPYDDTGALVELAKK